jgi:hypothetical protein
LPPSSGAMLDRLNLDHGTARSTRSIHSGSSNVEIAGDFRVHQYGDPTHRENRDEWESGQFIFSIAVLRELPLLAPTQVSPTPDRRSIPA